MHVNHYLDIFQQTAAQLNGDMLKKKSLQVATGIYRDSVFLKLYKEHWANPSAAILLSPSRIFFSAWISQQGIEESRWYYNIHAFKLRELRGYHIAARGFAQAFRQSFKPFEKDWPNVSTAFGPLTLMQGWVALQQPGLQAALLQVSTQFFNIDHLIDELLQQYRKR